MQSSSWSRAHFADLLFQKCPQHASFFHDKVLRACQFFRFLYEAEFSLQSHACFAAPPPKIIQRHFADLIFQTVARARQCFTIFYTKSTSRHSPVHFLSTTLPDRAPQLRKQRPSFGDRRSHITRKDTFFMPESVSTREFTRPRTVTLLYCSHTRTALAHFVVDMMMLTWGWHGDKTARGHSSVTRKF